MQFSTKVPISKNHAPIDYHSRMVSLGSCFAVNIAEKFSYYKFQSSVNPFGILFHPLAILQVVRRAVHNENFSETDIFFHNERWHCFEVHSDLSHPNKEVLLHNLNQRLVDLKMDLESASHIFITYGTAWAYRFKTSQKLVANCHKVPQLQFDKELLSITAIESAIKQTLEIIRSLNPDVSIVFTVSPVRHLKDGFTENQRSKSHLIAAIHQTAVDYFPSYEIMMDELRDYRFYAEDLLHPNTVAIQYIWEQFVSASISREAIAVIHEVESIQKGLSHKPFNQESESHLKFTTQLQLKIAQLQKQFSYMKF